MNETKFWIIAISIFLVITAIAAKLTLKKFRKSTGDRNWRLWYGRAWYWEILCTSTAGITMLIILTLHWMSIITF